MSVKEIATRIFWGIPYAIGIAVIMLTLASCVLLGGPEPVMLVAWTALEVGTNYPIPVYGGVVLLVVWYFFADRYFKQQRKKKESQKWAEKRKNRPI